MKFLKAFEIVILVLTLVMLGRIVEAKQTKPTRKIAVDFTKPVKLQVIFEEPLLIKGKVKHGPKK